MMDERAHIFFLVAVALSAVTALVVLLRLFAQTFTRGRIGLDDTFAYIGAVIAVGLVVVSGKLYAVGVGQHTLDVLSSSPNPIEQVIEFLKLNYAFNILFAQSMFWTKLGLVYYYRRVFANVRTSRLHDCRTLVMEGYIVTVGIIATINAIVQCVPLEYTWLQGYNVAGYLAPISGMCPMYVMRSQLSSLLGVISDLLIILVPLVKVWRLKLDFKQKIGVIFILILGAFGITISFARIRMISNVAGTGDIFYLDAIPVFFTVLETDIAILCACLPDLAPLVGCQNVKSSILPEHSYGRVSDDMTNPHQKMFRPSSDLDDPALSPIWQPPKLNLPTSYTGAGGYLAPTRQEMAMPQSPGDKFMHRWN